MTHLRLNSDLVVGGKNRGSSAVALVKADDKASAGWAAYLLALTILLLPTYTVRFELFGLPVNLLMLWTLLIWTVFAVELGVKKQFRGFFASIKSINIPLLILSGMFFLSGLVGLFWQNFSQAKLGQFVVLFVEPLSLFFIANFIWQNNPSAKKSMLYAVYCILAALGVFAAIQYFTLFGLPAQYWGNAVEPKRALSFFSHPNFYALFSAPLLAFLLADLGLKIKDLRKNWFFFAAWIIGGLGLLLSFSRAGWLGLGVAGLVYVLFAAEKKIRKLALAIFVIMVVVIVSVPNLRWRFILPFYGEKSAVSRLSLWHTGVKGIAESPVFGLGLTGFAQNWDRLNTDPNLDRHNFPHNLALDLWVETGILGLIAMVGLISFALYKGLVDKNNLFKLSVALFMVTLLTQGLIDNPYFKNDLAMVFWLIFSLGLWGPMGEPAVPD